MLLNLDLLYHIVAFMCQKKNCSADMFLVNGLKEGECVWEKGLFYFLESADLKGMISGRVKVGQSGDHDLLGLGRPCPMDGFG